MQTPVSTNAPPEVGAALQRLRLARGLTLEDLSRIAGVSKSMLSQIEREKANPTIAITWRLANALGVQIGELLATAEKPRKPSAYWRPTRPPPCPASTPAISCAFSGRWNWRANMNGMN